MAVAHPWQRGMVRVCLWAAWTVFLAAGTLTALAAAAPEPADSARPFRDALQHLRPHPRLLLSDARLAELKQLQAGDHALAAAVKAALAQADQELAKPVPTYEAGPGAWATPGKHHIYALAFAYRWTGDAKYARKLETDLLAVAAFNWNQVCNGGTLLGVLGIAEDAPDIAARVLQHAVTALPLALQTYDEDGLWPEGLDYWQYATEYTVWALAGLDTALGTDFGLSDAQRFKGLAQTGQAVIFGAGPLRQYVNFADTLENKKRWALPYLFWLGARYGQPALAGRAHVVTFRGEEASPAPPKALLDPLAVVDVSSAYPAAGKALRGLRLLGGRRAVLVQDEFTLSAPRGLCWAMTTDAEIQVEKNTATLTLKGKRLKATLLAPTGAEFAQESTARQPPENRNAGVRRLVVPMREVQGAVCVAVLLAPEWPGQPELAAPPLVPLADW